MFIKIPRKFVVGPSVKLTNNETDSNNNNNNNSNSSSNNKNKQHKILLKKT